MEEFRICPECGYKRGFHVAFRKARGKVRIFLICPNCGRSYDIGWGTAAIKSFKPEKGEIY